MSKHRHGWPEAKKLCRLNQNDITMAKSLGFRPDTLVRARPDPKQKWKLPVKDWIHELHRKRFGFVLAEKPVSAPAPTTPEEEEEAARLFEQQLYWEDYRERNRDDRAGKHQARGPNQTAAAIPTADGPTMDEPADEPVDEPADEPWLVEEITAEDRDLPF